MSASAVVDVPGLREGVAALRVPRGVLYQDALLWQVALVPSSANPQGARRWLESRGLLEGAPVPAARPRVSQVFRVKPGEAPGDEVRVAPGARFSCACCGSSCRGMRLGPILPADAERLIGLDWSGTGRDPADFFIDVDEQPLQGPPSKAGWVELRRENGACQFLRPDNLCEVHARFGEAQKPVMCRVFPLEFRATQAGLLVGVRLGECVSAEQAGAGSPLDGQREELRALHREGGKVSLVPPLLWLADGALVTLVELESLEERLLAEPAPEPGGLGLALRLLDAVEARAQAPALPSVPQSSFAGLFAEVRVVPGMPLALAHGARLSPGAQALEEQIVRASIFAKDSALHPDIASGAALLVVHARLSRARARAVAASQGLTELPAALLNHSWKEVASLGVRVRLAELKIAPRAAARSLEELRLV